MVRVRDDIDIGEDEIGFSFSRSSGPGGQNVNKVSSAVQLRFDLRNSPSLPIDMKHRARRLAEQLCKAGYNAVGLQGNMSQPQRDRAMGGFREGKFKILVATDIAARGIDVLDCSSGGLTGSATAARIMRRWRTMGWKGDAGLGHFRFTLVHRKCPIYLF